MTMKIELPIKGGCQCGALRYEITLAPLMIYACHCTNCQRISGSAFALATTIWEKALTFTSGKPKRVNWQADSGTARFGIFCGDCGCRIAHGQEPSNGFLSLRAGTFDDPRWITPAGHIWTKSAQPWFRFGPAEILYDKQPDDYVPFIEKFKTEVTFEDCPADGVGDGLGDDETGAS